MITINEKIEKMREDVKRHYSMICAAMQALSATAGKREEGSEFDVAVTMWCLEHVSRNTGYFFESLTLAMALQVSADEMGIVPENTDDTEGEA